MTAKTRHQKALEAAIDDLNARLKGAKRKVAVGLKNSGLVLRATLPAKPDEPQAGQRQQRIRLPVDLTAAGVAEAERYAIDLAADIAAWRNGGQFPWESWSELRPRHRKREAETFRSVFARFEAQWRAERKQPSESTWRGDYMVPFRKLNPAEPFSVRALKEMVQSQPPESRVRLRSGNFAAALCKFVGLPNEIQLELREMGRGYSSDDVQPRDIPSDEQLLADIAKLPRKWLWCARVLYLYGCRPHELFFAEVDSDGYLVINDGKTGARDAVPVVGDGYLIGEWNLYGRDFPPNVGKKSEEPERSTTNEINKALGAAGIQWRAYTLRHAYGGRSYVRGMSERHAALSMGHTVEIHRKVYNRWVRREELRAGLRVA